MNNKNLLKMKLKDVIESSILSEMSEFEMSMYILYHRDLQLSNMKTFKLVDIYPDDINEPFSKFKKIFMKLNNKYKIYIYDKRLKVWMVDNPNDVGDICNMISENIKNIEDYVLSNSHDNEDDELYNVMGKIFMDAIQKSISSYINNISFEEWNHIIMPIIESAVRSEFSNEVIPTVMERFDSIINDKTKEVIDEIPKLVSNYISNKFKS